MKPSDKIENVVKKMSFKVGPEMDRDLWAETSKARNEFHKKILTASQHNIWGITMRSPITKIAVATVIIIACITGVLMFRETSEIALADVLTRIEQVSAYMYKMHWTETKQQTASEVASTVLISQDNGIKMIQTRVDPNSGESRDDEIYLLPRENILLIVLHQERKLYRIKWEDAEEDYYKEKYNDPHTVIKEILNCSHTSLGQSIVDGKTVEGFQTTDLAYKGGFFGRSDLMAGAEVEKIDVKLWVNVETFLPIRFEEDIITKGGMHIHEVSYDFHWNVVVNDRDFEPNITEDYNSPNGDWNIPAFNEENTIKGLRLFANYAGSYPVNLDSEALKKEAKKYLESGHVSYEELSEDEKTKYNSELFTMLTAVVFYDDLVKENKDPVYYGQNITPKDADKVLMRWKVSDNEYRVIYGDLHVETVTPEKLAELEAALPK